MREEIVDARTVANLELDRVKAQLEERGIQAIAFGDIEREGT